MVDSTLKPEQAEFFETILVAPFAELWLLRQTGGVLVEAHPDSPGVGGERPRGRGVKRGEA